MTLPTPKLPPQNLEAEQAILGNILVTASLMTQASERLVPADFYAAKHQHIYSAMLALSNANQPIDQITVTGKLKELGTLEQAGGYGGVAELTLETIVVSDIVSYCKLVKDRALARRLAHATGDLWARCYKKDEPIQDLLNDAERSIFAISQGQVEQGFVPITSALKEGLDLVDQLSKRTGHITGVPTGFQAMDQMLAGLQPSDLIILAARPSMGKTSLALNMALHAALQGKLSVGIFSLEMSRPQIVMRLLASEAKINAHSLRTGRLSQQEWWQLAQAAQAIEQAKLHIDDTGLITIQQMRGKARRLKSEHGLDLLVVDYLQLMQGSGGDSRQQDVSEISRSLKLLAKELNVPVVALSQLSRRVEERKPPVPMLADLRDSGAIEQDADVVLFIYREQVYEPHTDRQGIADILVSKHRNGPIGRVELQFHEQYATFADLNA
jgi:replicative DNA helicase